MSEPIIEVCDLVRKFGGSLTAHPPRHKGIFMRTTLDLPDDVGRVLREESFRRGGRGKAPIAQLVAEAVRARYGVAAASAPRKIGRAGNLPVVRRAFPCEVLDEASIARALDEIP
jgi:hypothetical protein